MGSFLSLSVPAVPQSASKATQTEWNCPVCRSVHSNSEAVPCGHQFCLGCLLRCTATSAVCPLCASPVLSARFSVLGQSDFLQCVLSPPALAPGTWERRALFRLVYTSPRPLALQPAPSPAEPGSAGPEAVDSFPPDLWAELLHGHEHLLDPVRPWLRQSLDAIYGPRWWEAREVESITLSILCICGPDRDILAQMLQSYLREYTAPLVQGLIHVTMHQCREAWLLRRCHAAQEEDESPAATTSPLQAPGPDPTGPSMDDQPSTPEPAHHGGPSPSLPTPVEQHQPQRVPGQDPPAPGPSARGRGRTRQPRGIRRSQRRRPHKARRTLKSRRRKQKRK